MNKLLKKILIVFMPILIIGFTCTHFNYYYGEVSSSKLAMDEMRKNKNYDVAIIGPSTGQTGIIPKILNKELEINAINLSSSAQLACDSYFIAKEYIKYNKPKFIIMVIEPSIYFGINRYKQSFGNTTIATLETMKPSWNKFKFEIRMLLERPQIALDFLNYNFRLNFLEKKYEETYNLEQLSKLYGNEYYISKKGVMLFKSCQNRGSVGNIELLLKLSDKGDYKYNVKRDYGFKYLQKMIDLCKKNGVELFLLTQGTTDAQILAYKYWDYMIGEFEKIAIKNKVNYWNFSFSKPNLWSRRIRNWANNGHVSKHGAEKLTEALCKLIKITGGGTDTSKYFYKTYKEYLATVDIASLWLDREDNGLTAKCTYGMNGKPLYKFYGKKDDKNCWEFIKDYSYDATLDKKYYVNKYKEIKVYGKLDTGKLERYAILNLKKPQNFEPND